MKIGQIYLTEKPSIQDDGYSDNQIPNEVIVSLQIYACPGSRFKINDNDDIIMNGTGNFNLNCNDFPITSIRIHEDNLIGTIPTIIDYVSWGV